MKEKYIVNKEKRTVVCILSNCSEDVLKAIDKSFRKIFISDLYINDKYVGVAKCSPEDEWDEKIGKRLAFSRAYAEYRGAIKVKARKFIANMENEMQHFKEVMEERGML